jgi:fucose 4-O-acetylase-like acetyltransferase
MLLCLKMKTKLVSKKNVMPLKKLDSGHSPKKEVSTVSVNVICAVFSPLFTSDDLVMTIW